MDSTKYSVSKRIEHMRPVLIFLVLLIHAERAFRGYAESIPSQPVVQYIIIFFRGNLCRIAVPLFFIISGYLFCCGLPEITDRKWYLSVMKKKFFRLVLPYLFFNVYLIVLVMFFTRIPGISGRIDPTITNFFGKLIPINSVPINFPLWYLRDLMFIFILSPILVIMLKEIPYFSLILLGVVWLWHGKRHGLYVPEYFFWFYLGAVIKHKNVSINITRKLFFLMCLCYTVLTITLSYTTYIEYSLPYYKFIYNFNIVMGMAILYYLSGTKLLQNKFIQHFTISNFFIFLCHEPMISLLQYFLCKKFTFTSVISQIFLYFFSAVFVFVLIDLVFYIFIRPKYKYLKQSRQELGDHLTAPVTYPEKPVVFQKIEAQTPALETQAAVIIRLSSATLEVREGTSQQTIQAVLLALQSVC